MFRLSKAVFLEFCLFGDFLFTQTSATKIVTVDTFLYIAVEISTSWAQNQKDISFSITSGKFSVREYKEDKLAEKKNIFMILQQKTNCNSCSSEKKLSREHLLDSQNIIDCIYNPK